MSSGGKHDTAVPRRRSRRILTVLGVLVLVCGLVVGYAHWHLHRLETADVAWSTPLDHGGDVVVAAGRVYTYDARGFQVTRLADGKKLTSEGASDAAMFVGDDGHFAVANQYRLTFYTPDGRKLWDRRQDPAYRYANVPVAIGSDTVTYRSCTQHGRDTSCTLRAVDQDGKNIWTSPTTRLPSFPVRHHEVLRQDDAGEAASPVLQTIPSVPITERRGRLVQLDDAGHPTGGSIAADHATAVGDLMIESTRSGATCLYRGMRGGQVVWTGKAACPGTGEIQDIIAFRNRMYVGYDRDPDSVMNHPQHMVSVDLTDGDTHVFGRGWSALLAQPDETRIAAPDVIVEQGRHTLTGRSPATGKKLWSRSFDEDELSYPTSDGKGSRYSTVRASAGTVSTYSQHVGVWRRLAVGTQSPENVLKLLDPRTGETTARLLQDAPELVTTVRGKGTLVVSGHQLILLKEAS